LKQKTKEEQERVQSSPKQPLLNLTFSTLRQKEDVQEKLIDEEITQELLDKLKEFVLDYLGDQSRLILDPNAPSSVHEKVYTKLTYEVIKLTAMMLKFGMFKTKITKQELQNPVLAPLTFGIIKRSKSMFVGLEPQQTSSEVERLVSYLTPLLEFDKSYFESMEDLGVKRSKFFSHYVLLEIFLFYKF